ncbi:MAG: Mini-ribonuclease 3 [Clostridia bacterium]|nr:Mini-ribonuclease 3 [Clostridia bacterium]
MTKEQARLLPPLKLAFIGDTVCDLIVRTRLMFTDAGVSALHTRATATVNARAQAAQLDAVLHLLDEDEHDIVRRARNAHPGRAIPQHATREEYMKATGFEALMGYLYLTGQTRRAQTLFELGCLKENENA